jgi:antitoxin ParD1/3/4
MNVELPKELEEFLTELIQGGFYDTPSLAIHDALWMLKDRFDLYKSREAELRQLIAVGVEQADRGELIDGDEVFRRLREKREAHARTETP